MKKPLIYIIGSLKNRRNVMKLANNIRAKGFEVFDDWTSPGPEADLFCMNITSSEASRIAK